MVRTTEQGWALPLHFTPFPWHTELLTRWSLLCFGLCASPWAQSQTLSASPKSTAPNSHQLCLLPADLSSGEWAKPGGLLCCSPAGHSLS